MLLPVLGSSLDTGDDTYLHNREVQEENLTALRE